MSSLLEGLSQTWPTLKVIRLEHYLFQYPRLVGRPLADRVSIASAFIAKAVNNSDW
ncbi:MAG: hypothetical protein KAG28_09970 [Cocleimonas sp.]|nr:hypothetical protein [Cocleimonas sp.]